MQRKFIKKPVDVDSLQWNNKSYRDRHTIWKHMKSAFYFTCMSLPYLFEFCFCEATHVIFNSSCTECQNVQWIVVHNGPLTISGSISCALSLDVTFLGIVFSKISMKHYLVGNVRICLSLWPENKLIFCEF